MAVILGFQSAPCPAYLAEDASPVFWPGALAIKLNPLGAVNLVQDLWPGVSMVLMNGHGVHTHHVGRA